jgi:CRISPR system Cascade subunit CasE
MYLSRLILNPRSRQVQRELADPYEMHRTIMHAFANHPRTADRTLFRLEIHPKIGIPTLLVQSRLEPGWDFLSAPMKNYLLPLADCPPGVSQNPAVKAFELRLYPGQTLAFRLKANPTVKKDREGKKQGRRVGLCREEDQLQWLKRKLEAAGAILLSARPAGEGKLSGRLHHDGQRHDLTFMSVQFDGILRVSDPDKLHAAIENGIGSSKGFGFGLLSLAPA